MSYLGERYCCSEISESCAYTDIVMRCRCVPFLFHLFLKNVLWSFNCIRKNDIFQTAPKSIEMKSCKESEVVLMKVFQKLQGRLSFLARKWNWFYCWNQNTWTKQKEDFIQIFTMFLSSQRYWGKKLNSRFLRAALKL